jgi:hypothetical protein
MAHFFSALGVRNAGPAVDAWSLLEPSYRPTSPTYDPIEVCRKVGAILAAAIQGAQHAAVHAAVLSGTILAA